MTDRVSYHPLPTRLDALAVGHTDEDAAAHVRECGACEAYVEAIRQRSESFANDKGRATDFVRAVRERAMNPPKVLSVPRRNWSARASVAVLALAAGVVLFVSSRRKPPDDGRLAAIEPPATEQAGYGPMRFKGRPQVAIVVEHQGSQSRQTGPLELVPGDRIRLEIGLDHDERIAAGVLAADGEWGELQPPSTLEAGTHYTEQSIAFERDVPRGWILVGTSDAVETARRTRDFRDVIAIRVGPKLP